MRALMLPVILVSTLMGGCDASLTAGDKSSVDLTYNMVEFKRQGGSKCPGEPGVKEDDLLCATVSFNYPEINSSANPELAGTLNTFIREQLLDRSTEGGEPVDAPETSFEAFADDFINEYKQDTNTFSSWEMQRSAEVLFANEKLLTLRFNEYGYTGGAHPYSGSRYEVLDMSNGQPVTLDDLMNPGYEAALNVAGEKAFRAARDLPEGSSLEEQGFTFENNVFMLNDNFGIDKDSLRFTFNSYEVAAYAMGPTDLEIRYEDIRSLIRPDGLLGDKAH